MSKIRSPVVLLVAALTLAAAVLATGVQAENIDPANADSQYAWSENAGWINAEPANCTDCGVEVSAAKVSGWMWSENLGWISLHCLNTGTCGTVNYGVTNDGAGNLAGYAWSENGGWISFSCTNTSYCGTVNYGVTIDTVKGLFSGYAWAENFGWVSFSCSNTSSCGAVDYGVRTSWTAGGVDSDNDGCPDTREQQVAGNSETSGGLRDPANFWDFFDVDTNNGAGAGLRLQGVVSLGNILTVAGRFGQTGDPDIDPLSDASGPGYHTRYDRGAQIGANVWNTGPANGAVSLGDVLTIATQFTHNCT